MTKDIDFMAHVDETTPPEIMLKMLLAAQRDKLKTNEEISYLKANRFGKSSEKGSKNKT